MKVQESDRILTIQVFKIRKQISVVFRLKYQTIFDILEEQKSSENPELKRATNYTKNIVSLNHF